MLDIGWSELLLIGIVALIVIGPKELPQLFRTLGRLTARARHMAREFSSAMEDAARDSGIDDATKTLRDVGNLTSRKSLGLDALDRAADRFEKWDPVRGASRDAAIQPDPGAPATDGPALAGSVAVPDNNAAGAAAPTDVRTGDPIFPPHPDGAVDQARAPRRQLHATRRADMKDR